jgi:hypothetical protein
MYLLTKIEGIPRKIYFVDEIPKGPGFSGSLKEQLF